MPQAAVCKPRNLKVLCAGLCVAFACEAAFAGEPTALEKAALSAIEAYEAQHGGIVGFCAADVRSRATLVELRAKERFLPASNQKLLTAAFALAKLGGEFEFTTEVCLLGKDLLLLGDGDPTLGDPVLAAGSGFTVYAELDRWAAAVKEQVGERGIRRIVACSTLRPEGARHPDWPAEQRRQWYVAPVSGLNFQDNCYDVTFTVVGGQVQPDVRPQSRFIRLENELKIGAKHVWSLRPNEDESVVTLKGTVKTSTSEPLSVAAENPPMLLARTFAERLARAGVEFGGEFGEADPAKLDLTEARLLCKTNTPLAEAIRRANKRSLNMTAECIFLRAGDGTWRGSAASMTETLVSRFGLDADGLVVRDGGGLAQGNRVSPANLTRLLLAMVRDANAMPFLLSLPESGMDGTLRSRLAEAGYRTRVIAKTGYVAGASALSGYVLDAQRRPAVAFSILVNRVSAGTPAKKLQDDLARMLTDHVDGR